MRKGQEERRKDELKKAKRAMWHGDLDNERVMRHEDWAKKRVGGRKRWDLGEH